MPLLIPLLVLISALLHALWNAGLRLERDKQLGVVVAIAIGTALAAMVAAVEYAQGRAPFATHAALTYTLIAGVLEAAYFTVLAHTLSIAPLGPVYTISRGAAVLLVWPISIWLWHESLSGLTIVGSLVVLLGLTLASSLADADRRAVRWALLCGALIASYHLAYKAAMAVGGAPAAVFTVSLGLATVINIVRLTPARRRLALQTLRTRGLRLGLVGATCAGAFLLLMHALAVGGAGAVITLRNSSVLFATLLAWRIGDKPTAAQLWGAACVALGAVLLGLS